MKPITETRFWFVLRYYHADSPDSFEYAKDISNSWDNKRYWSTTMDVREAYEFPNRSDARKTTRSVTLNQRIEKNFFWEVVKVVETKQVSYETEMIVSNAPPLYQLARHG